MNGDTVKVSRIRLNKRGLGVLSPLETDVLGILWSNDEARVRDIYTRLRKRRTLALTSVAVVLDRLYRKGMVSRRAAPGRGGYHYIYSAKGSRMEFEQSVIEKTVDRLIDAFGPTAVSYFHERFRRRK